MKKQTFIQFASEKVSQSSIYNLDGSEINLNIIKESLNKKDNYVNYVKHNNQQYLLIISYDKYLKDVKSTVEGLGVVCYGIVEGYHDINATFNNINYEAKKQTKVNDRVGYELEFASKYNCIYISNYFHLQHDGSVHTPSNRYGCEVVSAISNINNIVKKDYTLFKLVKELLKFECTTVKAEAGLHFHFDADSNNTLYMLNNVINALVTESSSTFYFGRSKIYGCERGSIISWKNSILNDVKTQCSNFENMLNFVETNNRITKNLRKKFELKTVKKELTRRNAHALLPFVLGSDRKTFEVRMFKSCLNGLILRRRFIVANLLNVKGAFGNNGELNLNNLNRYQKKLSELVTNVED